MSTHSQSASDLFERIRFTGQPVANLDSAVRSGKARFTVLTPRLIRLQWSETGMFEDRGTYAFPTRHPPAPEFTARVEGEDFRKLGATGAQLVDLPIAFDGQVRPTRWEAEAAITWRGQTIRYQHQSASLLPTIHTWRTLVYEQETTPLGGIHKTPALHLRSATCLTYSTG